jgi:hypothetical protein
MRPARALFVDDRGHGLQVTWHVGEGFVNLSMWRGDRCVETVRLSADEAARLVDALATPEPGERVGGPAAGSAVGP